MEGPTSRKECEHYDRTSQAWVFLGHTWSTACTNSPMSTTCESCFQAWRMGHQHVSFGQQVAWRAASENLPAPECTNQVVFLWQWQESKMLQSCTYMSQECDSQSQLQHSKFHADIESARYVYYLLRHSFSRPWKNKGATGSSACLKILHLSDFPARLI